MPGIIYCQYYDEEREALDEAPFPNQLGEDILKSISEDAWSEWLEMQIKIINEYKLDLGEKEDRIKLEKQLRSFLKFDNAADTLAVGTPTE